VSAVLAILISHRAAHAQLAHNIDRDTVAVYVYTRTVDAYAGAYGTLAARMRNDENVGALFLSVSMRKLDPTDAEYDSDYAPMIRSFVAAMHEEGIFVHAMYLQDETSLDNPALAQSRTSEIIAFDAQSATLEKFDGLNLDIEPERTDDWDYESMRFSLVQKLLAVMQAIRGEMTSTGCILPLSSALYAYYMEDGELQSYFTKNGISLGYPDDFLDWVDFVILMSYDDDYLDVISVVKDEIGHASRNGSIIVGMKTKDSGSDDGTFWDEGWQALCTAIGEVRSAFDYSGGPLMGFAVFEYDSYAALKAADPAPDDLKISFQGASGVLPQGYRKDPGLPYGIMGDLHYGWR
jgi:hypothetical protein